MQTQDDQQIETQPLTARLARERLMLRLLLVSDAVLRCIPIACAVIGVGALLDWWVRFPSLIRAFLAVTAVMLSLRWAYRRIWRPVVSNIPLDQLAIRLSSAQPELRDKLAGAAAYLRAGGAGSAALWGDLVSHAGDDVPRDFFESHIRRRRLPVRAIIAAVAVAGAAAAMSNIPITRFTPTRRISCR